MRRETASIPKARERLAVRKRVHLDRRIAHSRQHSPHPARATYSMVGVRRGAVVSGDIVRGRGRARLGGSEAPPRDFSIVVTWALCLRTGLRAVQHGDVHLATWGGG